MPVWGSKQIGSAQRFSSAGKPPPNSGYQPEVSQAQLESPPSPINYQGLRIGPETVLEYEGNQARPIDGSNRLLRVLSPFMIQVEPPLIMGEMPTTKSKDYAGILDAGHSGAPRAFTTARSRIQQGGPPLPPGGSVEDLVHNGKIRRDSSEGPRGSISVDRGDLGPSRVGTPAIVDLQVAVDITRQLRNLVNTPPLILLINPGSLSVTYAKIQQFNDRTRYGFVFQAWGEEQPKMTVVAKCGAFISGGRGVQFASRLDSSAWQNFQTAFQFYQSNGYIYDTVGKSNAHHMVGALSIHYDGWVYYGNMESFNYTLGDDKPYGGIEFTMDFIITAMVDTSKQNPVVSPMRSPIPSPSDPRYHGKSNKASARPGQVSVGPDGVHVGGHDFFSTNRLLSGSNVAPDGQTEQVSSPAALRVHAPKSSSGFAHQESAVEQLDSAVAQRRPVLFGGR